MGGGGGNYTGLDREYEANNTWRKILNRYKFNQEGMQSQNFLTYNLNKSQIICMSEKRISTMCLDPSMKK